MSETPTPAPQDEELKGRLETLLFITDRPLSLDELRKLTKVKDAARLQTLVGELRQKLEDDKSALQVMEVAGGYQMATRPAHADLVRKLFTDRMTLRLSTAAHETLAIIAYKQPLTRAEIEDIRGVEVIAALESLLEKRLIKVVGRKESVGRPLLYGTTADFMRHFGLRSLEDLPPIENFQPPVPGTSETKAVPDAEAALADESAPVTEAVSSEPPAEAAAASETEAVPEAEAAPETPAEPQEPPAQPIWPSAEEPPAEPSEETAPET